MVMLNFEGKSDDDDDDESYKSDSHPERKVFLHLLTCPYVVYTLWHDSPHIKLSTNFL